MASSRILAATANPFRPQKRTTDCNQVRDVFMNTVTNLEAEHARQNLVFPDEIVWVVGPSKSGKTSLAIIVNDFFGNDDNPVPMRLICRTVLQKNSGKLNINEVIESLVDTLLKSTSSRVVVDDFVSTTCARLLPFLFEYIKVLAADFGRPEPKFKFLILYTEKATAMQRQVAANGENALEPHAFYKLYQKFYKRTQQVVEILNIYFNFNIVDCNGTLMQTEQLALEEIECDTNGSRVDESSLKDLLSIKPTVTPRNNRPWKDRQRSSQNQRQYQQRGGRNYPQGMYYDTSYYGYDDRYVSQIKSQQQYEALQQQFHAWKIKKLKENQSNLYDIPGFQEMANGIEDPTEIAILAETTANLKPLMTGEMKVKTFRGNTIAKTYKMQYFVNEGKRAMLYWSTHGLCYFVDERGNFLEMAKQQYRHIFTDTLLDGCIVHHRNHHIFVINDIVQKAKKMYATNPTTTRMKVIKEEIMPVIAEQNSDFKIVFNEPLTPTTRLLKDMHHWESDEQFKPVRLDGVEIPAGGYIFIPMNTRFQFTKKNSALTWIHQSEKTNDQLTAMVKHF